MVDMAEEIQRKPEKLTPTALVIGLVVLPIIFAFWGIGIYDISRKIGRSYDISNAYENLKQRSNAHVVLVETYESCRNHLLNKSRQACIVEMKEFAEIEGLSPEFDAVYHDIKSELWPL